MAKYVDLELHVHHETDAALLVSDDGVEEGAVWLPKSQIQFDEDIHAGDNWMLTLPVWLAKDKGLI